MGISGNRIFSGGSFPVLDPVSSAVRFCLSLVALLMGVPLSFDRTGASYIIWGARPLHICFACTVAALVSSTIHVLQIR